MDKPKTTKNRALLDSFKNTPCLICGSVETTVAHHLKSKGSGGPDQPWNLMPLCHIHHDQVHRWGLSRFADTYSIVFKFLSENGWNKRIHIMDNKLKWTPPHN